MEIWDGDMLNVYSSFSRHSIDCLAIPQAYLASVIDNVTVHFPVSSRKQELFAGQIFMGTWTCYAVRSIY